MGIIHSGMDYLAILTQLPTYLKMSSGGLKSGGGLTVTNKSIIGAPGVVYVADAARAMGFHQH